MSRIYFHSPSGDTELRGSERANMGILCGNILSASVGSPMFDYPDHPHWLRKLLPNEHWIAKSNAGFEYACALFIRSQSGTDGFVYNGQTLPMFNLALNTALFSGSDPVKLLVRLHGQCEIHCYVVGKNRRFRRKISGRIG